MSMARGTQLCMILAAAALVSCSKSAAEPAGPGSQSRRPIAVGYVVARASSVPIVQDLPGRVAAFEISEVRPQVSGIILRRLFQEGSIVHQGQTLYQIDPRIYRDAAAQASANLAGARASAQAANELVARYRPLTQLQFVSKQDYATALAQAGAANALVEQNAAALRTAQTNLHFTSVPAPITGRIGASVVTQGALVTAGQTDALTTITRLDPVYVDIQQAAADLLALRHSLARGGAEPTTAIVELLLPDGTVYPSKGTVQFSQVTVDQNTGAVTIRALFPNPQNVLLPGMFVKARFAQALNTQAFLVPQQGLSRNPQGEATVWVVGAGNRAMQRTVVADRTQGAFWVVTSGLAAGDRVITQGTTNLVPDALVRPVPADAPQRISTSPATPVRNPA